MSKVDIVGYTVEAGSRERCIAEIGKILDSDRRHCAWMACLNPHSYAIARRDISFKKALRSAHWLVPDGVGIVIAGRILGQRISERITGFDIFEGVMVELNRCGGSVFFLGSTKDSLDLITQRVRRDYPNICIAGVYSPPFKSHFSEMENDSMIAAVAASKADVLWVGMTAPKQEKWIAAHCHRLPVKFAGPIGAVFDFYTGKVKRSHPYFQKLGLEWLPRLLQEPKRLWRRMFVSAPIFISDIIIARFTMIKKN
jgi:N-acetylglucosaminyldiphosphoundecaprenol N-acetyl-beta-D-mannosaminyltransferase